MKILFINLPYFGHVIPTIGLVQELVRRNHQVTYLLPFDWENVISDSGATFLGYENHKKLDEQIKQAFCKAKEVIDNYDILIYEQFFFVGKHLADKYHKPSVRIFTAPATNKEIMKKYISSGGPLGVFRFDWIARAWTSDLTKRLGICLNTSSWLDEIVCNPADINFVYTTKEFQLYAEEFPREKFFFLGPSVFERKEPELALNKEIKPVIYISLGTILKGAKSFYRKCIDAFKDERVTVIMSVGKSFRIKKLGKLPQNFIVVNSAPQVAVLKRADIFITHGGMNSISEAMTFGVPMIVIPFVSDQLLNAEQVERLGLGVRLVYSKINAHILRDIVFSVLNDSKIKNQVVLAKNKVASSLGNQGAVHIIERQFTATNN